MPRRTRFLRVALATCLVVALPGCGTGHGRNQLTVLAAASLSDAFTAIGERFEAAHDGVVVRFAFAGSQQLAAQVLDGAPADVFASADRTQMDTVVAAGAVAGAPRPFARNGLAIAVEPGNPRDLDALADLADPALTLVLAAPGVPAGRYARRLLDAAQVRVRPDSLETDVRAVLSKVALGEADAGIVYASDVVAADGDVAQVPIPADQDITATYPIAALAHTPSPDLATAFVDFVLSDPGQALLAEHGFAARR